MKQSMLARLLGASLAVTVLWAVAVALGGSVNPLQWLAGRSQAAPPAKNPCNPCNPGGAAAQASNPCNPCNPGGAAAQASNPCNPCNPGGAAAQASNPCNPCNPGGAAAQASNPCNPCNPGGAAAQASNPCNPCSPGGAAVQAANPCNPDAGRAANPCNPGSARQASVTGDSGKIGWARDFKSWDAVTGYVISNSHGNRLVQTYIYPPEAARVYKHNAELARLRKQSGYRMYPPGTQIVQESWLRNDVGGPGRAGPVFFMRKEESGYDSAGNDWHYGFTRNDLSLVGEGHEGKMQFCKECHARADRRDFVYATER